MNSKVLVFSIFALFIIALATHMLIPKEKNIIRRFFQTVLVLIWLVLAITLVCSSKNPEVIMMGNWHAPFGIALVTDQLSNVMILVFAIVTTCINFYSYQDIGIVSKHQAFYSGFWLLLLGVCGATLTSDIFNLYVWFEVILVSAFILLASSPKPKPIATFHYAIMNIIGTLLMLLAIALIYGAYGTLNYAGIAEKLSNIHSFEVLPVLCLFIFALGLKSAIFPLYFWLPKAYPKPSYSSTMLLSSLITKVVMVVLLRLAWLWLPIHQTFLTNSLLWVALATMVFGVLGAASQFRFKDILAFHIVSQLGYILLAIVLPLPMAIIAGVYFLIHNILVKTNLFMVAGILEQHIGTDDFKKLGGALKHHKYIAIVFFLAAMSLAGFPPLSGFWAKLLLIQAALSAKFYISTAVAIVVSLLTLYSMVKIWRYVFCEQPQIKKNTNSKPIPFSWALTFSVSPLFLIPIIMGLWPDGILILLKPISTQLAQPEHYIHLVLGVNR